MNSNLLSALLQALISNPQLLTDLVGSIENLFHHPTVQPVLPTPVVPTPGPAPTPVPAPPAPAVFSPQPGKIGIIAAINTETDQPATVPYHRNTKFHLDHNLLNPLPWPKGNDDVPPGIGITPWNPGYVWSWDGVQGGGGDQVSAGSMDSDGYSGRFHINSLHDTAPHTLAIALQLTVNGQVITGPFLKLPVQQV